MSIAIDTGLKRRRYFGPYCLSEAFSDINIVFDLFSVVLVKIYLNSLTIIILIMLGIVIVQPEEILYQLVENQN